MGRRVGVQGWLGLGLGLGSVIRLCAGRCREWERKARMTRIAACVSKEKGQFGFWVMSTCLKRGKQSNLVGAKLGQYEFILKMSDELR
jgi:hypothetical protein